MSKTPRRSRVAMLLALGCVVASLAAQGCRAKQAPQSAANSTPPQGSAQSQQQQGPNVSFK